MVTAFAACGGHDTLVSSRKTRIPCRLPARLIRARLGPGTAGSGTARAGPPRYRRAERSCLAPQAGWLPARGGFGHICAGFWPRLGLAGATGLAGPAGPVIEATACWAALMVAAVAAPFPSRVTVTGFVSPKFWQLRLAKQQPEAVGRVRADQRGRERPAGQHQAHPGPPGALEGLVAGQDEARGGEDDPGAGRRP